MEIAENGTNGGRRVALVELEIVNNGAYGGFRWRYRFVAGARSTEMEMEELSRPVGLFEAALRGALDAMIRVREGESVRIQAPTYPLVLGMTRWINRWLLNGWHTRFGGPVCHRELWEGLWHLSAQRQVEWVGTTMLPEDWVESTGVHRCER